VVEPLRSNRTPLPPSSLISSLIRAVEFHRQIAFFPGYPRINETLLNVHLSMHHCKAFTLIELLLVIGIAIIGIAISCTPIPPHRSLGIRPNR
jgi:hypothetical protein